jgi:hypothetical protein
MNVTGRKVYGMPQLGVRMTKAPRVFHLGNERQMAWVVSTCAVCMHVLLCVFVQHKYLSYTVNTFRLKLNLY